MLNKLAQRSRDEKGFTLIELLVVILIIGILAAIALPAFLGQRVKGQDSSAKSNARNAVSEVESCYATENSYDTCAVDATASDAGIDDTVITSNGDDANGGYTITSTSESDNTFSIDKTGSVVTRECTDTGSDKGGCKSDGKW